MFSNLASDKIYGIYNEKEHVFMVNEILLNLIRIEIVLG